MMIGTDYELFIKAEGNIIPVPDILYIGDKEGDHIQLVGGTMHRDNVMVEICPEPVHSPQEMNIKVASLNAQAEKYISDKLKVPISLEFLPTVEFSDNMLESLEAQEIGCDRDYLANRGDVIGRIPINTLILGNNRCGGGHIHISYGVTKDISPAAAVHMADLTLGTLEVTFGKQGARRQYYGLPGLFRPKTYDCGTKGIEYRTPSNIWLANKERIIAMTTNALSLEKVLKLEPADKVHNFIQQQWAWLMDMEIINKEDKNKAHAMLGIVQSTFPKYEWRVGI